jgi:hypothetical protein
MHSSEQKGLSVILSLNEMMDVLSKNFLHRSTLFSCWVGLRAARHEQIEFELSLRWYRCRVNGIVKGAVMKEDAIGTSSGLKVAGADWSRSSGAQKGKAP